MRSRRADRKHKTLGVDPIRTAITAPLHLQSSYFRRSAPSSKARRRSNPLTTQTRSATTFAGRGQQIFVELVQLVSDRRYLRFRPPFTARGGRSSNNAN